MNELDRQIAHLLEARTRAAATRHGRALFEDHSLGSDARRRAQCLFQLLEMCPQAGSLRLLR